MTDYMCSEQVMLGYNLQNCSKTPKHQEDGKWWCGTHLPSAVAAKKSKRAAKWAADWAVRTKNNELQKLYIGALDKLRAYYDGDADGALGALHALLDQETALKAEVEALKKKAEELSK